MPNEPTEVAREIVYEGKEYETLYRVPASEDYPYGHAVGFAIRKGWAVAVCWYEDDDGSEQVNMGDVAVDLGVGGSFPGSTKWMITDNSAIDYGIPLPEEHNE